MDVKSGRKVYLSSKCGGSERKTLEKLAQEIQAQMVDMGERIAISSKKYLTTLEAAKYLSISKYTLDSYACKNIIPYYKPQNRHRYYLKEDLDNFVLNNENRVKSKDEIEADASSWALKNNR